VPVNQVSDFSRNFRKLEAAAKRLYSLSKVIRELAKQPPRLTGFELEVDEELRCLNRGHNVMGTLIPLEILCRDLTAGSLPQTVQTSVGEEIIPFLRYKSITGR
jgi:hypothetical protein